MKKIIALILVAVLAALTLTGCAYSYSKDDMTKYAAFDNAAFSEALTNLQIKDGDFTTDEEVRARKVLESIYSTLAGKADTKDHKTEGVAKVPDLVYYCYYYTAEVEVDGETVTLTFNTSKMSESSAVKLELGKTYDAYQDKIIKALADFDFANAYSTDKDTSYEVKAGDTVYITYTVSYDEEAEDGTKTTSKTTYTNIVKTLTEGDPLSDALIGEKLATSLSNITLTEDGVEKTYSGIKMNWLVKSGEEVTVKDTTYTESKKEQDVYKIVNGSTDLKDVELTYHVYPVYYIDVKDLSAESIMQDIFGEKISESSLDIFSDEDLKDGDGKTIAELVAELPDIIKELKEAKDARDDAKDDVDDAEEDVKKAQEAHDKAQADDKSSESDIEKTQSDLKKAQEALEAAQEELDTQQEKVDEKQGAVDEKIAAILGLKEDLAETVVSQYKESVYDSLEVAYNKEIKENLSAAIWEALKENTKVTSLPEKPVKDAYDKLISNYEREFYTGTYYTKNESGSSVASGSNYAHYRKFQTFMTEGGIKDGDTSKTFSSYAEALAYVRSQAEDAVEPIVILYAAAAARDLLVTDKEYKQYAKEMDNYKYHVSTYGEDALRNSYQLNRFFDTVLESEEEDGKVTYKNITYSIKEAE